MARMHSRARGKSGSKKPLKKIPSWAPYKENEVEKLVVKFGKAGKTTSEIGLMLRDTYGVSSVRTLTSKKVSQILTENEIVRKLPEDVLALIAKLVVIKQHLEMNKKDFAAGRGQILTTSKIRRLVKYYKRCGKIAQDWELDTTRLKMYLE